MDTRLFIPQALAESREAGAGVLAAARQARCARVIPSSAAPNTLLSNVNASHTNAPPTVFYFFRSAFAVSEAEEEAAVALGECIVAKLPSSESLLRCFLSVCASTTLATSTE